MSKQNRKRGQAEQAGEHLKSLVERNKPADPYQEGDDRARDDRDEPPRAPDRDRHPG